MSDLPDDFNLLDHTADIGLQARGTDLSSLFANAARGMFTIITDLDSIQPVQRIPIAVSADALEDLLVAWLSELLYLFSVRKLVLRRFEMSAINDQHLQATVFGETIDLARHELLTEIKAVTYHDLKISRSNKLWTARVLFDI